jgi:hypothetical protein
MFEKLIEYMVMNGKRGGGGMGSGPEVALLEAKLAAYREAWRVAFVAYLVVGHGMTRSEAMGESERVMMETDRRLEGEHLGANI